MKIWITIDRDGIDYFLWPERPEWYEPSADPCGAGGWRTELGLGPGMACPKHMNRLLGLRRTLKRGEILEVEMTAEIISRDNAMKPRGRSKA